MSSSSPTPPTTEPVWRRRIRAFTLALLVLLWIGTGAIVIWANTNEHFGSGTRLVITCVTVTASGIVSLLWFATLAPVRRGLRWGITAAIVGLIALLSFSLRLEGVSGGMRPRFALRWSLTADQKLAPLPSSRGKSNSPVDLTIVTADDYPRFLGADQRQSIDGVEFDTNWSDVPPRRLWKRPIGAGWSSFAVVNGYAVTQEQRGSQELVTCYDVLTGEPVWASPIEARHETTLGGVGPRSTPCIDQGRVYTIGGTGVFRCLDGASGDQLWRHDLLREMNVGDDSLGVAWGRAGSPLIVDNLVVVPVGGPADGAKTSLVAYDKITGDEAWRAGDRQIGYASPVRATLAGRDQVIIVLEDYVCSFDSGTGQLVWEHPWPGRSTADANVPNAVPLKNNQVFLCKGYGHGSELLQISNDESGHCQVATVWKKPVIMKSKFSNVIAYGSYVFGMDDVILECVEIATGRKVWKKGRYGYGQILRAGTTLIVLSESGELIAVEATHERFIEHGRFRALEGKCWNYMCLTGPYLLARNATEAACFELPNYRRTAVRAVVSSDDIQRDNILGPQ